MNRYRMLFVQTSTITSSTHQKITKHGWSFMHNNQLPTINLVELEDDSNGLWPEFKGGAASTWLKIDKKLFHLAFLKTIYFPKRF